MIRQHTDREYEAELQALREQLLLMGAKVEEMVSSSMKALVERDSNLAHKMIRFDNEIDGLELAVDNRCLRILAKRQPVASDLRFITFALKIVTDLERIGDLGVNICERAIELNAEPPLKPYIDLPRMAEAVQTMIRESLDMFVSGNADRAPELLEQDHLVDAYFGQVFRELLTYMLEDPKTIHRAIKIQSVAKYLERIGDHATNLAEMVIFMTRGKDVRHLGRQRPKGTKPHGVLFLDEANTAASQLAEALARKLFPAGVRICSAGLAPGARIDPLAIKALDEAGVDSSGLRPKGLAGIPMGDLDTVVVLDDPGDTPLLSPDLNRICWKVSLATPGGEDADKLRSYRELRDELRQKLKTLILDWID